MLAFTDRQAIFRLTFACFVLLLFFTRIHGSELFFISVGDDHAYYSYSRALLVRHSLDFHDTPLGGFPPGDGRMIAARFPMGPGLLWLPFTFVAHGIARLLLPGTSHELSLGISAMDFLGASTGSALYGFASFYLLYLFLRRWFSVPASFWSVLFVGFSSPFLYYLVRRPLMSHATEMFCLTGSLWLISQLDPESSWLKTLTAGLMVGLLFLNRWTYAPQCLILAFWALYRLMPSAPPRTFKLTRRQVLFMLTSGLCVLSQLVLWKQLLGSFNPGVKALRSSAPGNSLFFALYPWTLRHLRDLWVGFDWGVLLMSPVVLLSLWGLFRAWRRAPGLLEKTALLSGSLILLWMFSNWQTTGGEYGARYLIALWIPFTLGFASLVDRGLEQGKYRQVRGLLVLSAAALLYSLLLLTLFKSNSDSLTLRVAPNQYGMSKDWINDRYTVNAASELVHKPARALSTFGVTVMGYFTARALDSRGLLPRSLREAYLDYFNRHTLPSRAVWIYFFVSSLTGFAVLTFLGLRFCQIGSRA